MANPVIALDHRFGGATSPDRIRATSGPRHRHRLLDLTTMRPPGTGTGNRHSLHRALDTAHINQTTAITGAPDMVMADLPSGPAFTGGTHNLLRRAITKANHTRSTKKITPDTRLSPATLLVMAMREIMPRTTGDLVGMDTRRPFPATLPQSVTTEQVFPPSLDLTSRPTDTQVCILVNIRRLSD